MRILICDDHALIRSGINNHFINEPEYYIVGEAENGFDLIQKYELSIVKTSSALKFVKFNRNQKISFRTKQVLT